MSAYKKYFKWIGWVVLALFVLAQFARFVVPVLALDNPPITNQVNWDSPETEQLWKIACADCHSNETVYPWYSYVAPFGWLIAVDVNDGRRHLNVSTGHRIELHEMLETIFEGEMPPDQYLITHLNADLTREQRQALADGLRATFAGYNSGDDHEGGGHDNNNNDNNND